MTGEGGTGKTRVIECITAVAELWGQPHSVVRAAATGGAAANIKGQTLHSLHLLGDAVRITHQLTRRWSLVRMLIIDEVSFLGRVI